MRMTKEQNEILKNKILNEWISLEGYNIEPKNNKEKLQYLYDIFKAEYGFNIARLGLNKAFAEWLKGLPSCFNIPFWNVDILKLAEELGQDTTTEKQQEKILNSYWDFITTKTFKLFSSFKIDARGV